MKLALIAAAAITVTSTPALADYAIDYSSFHYDSTNWASAPASASRHGGTCENHYDNGVVRSFYLKERNLKDYRKSYSFCRDMDADGTLKPGYSKISHFSYNESGTTGDSSIPLNSLPVGVRTHWKSGGDKLVDVEMLFDDADDIYRDRTDEDRAGAALGNSSSDKRKVQCNPGFVMTGLWIKAKHGAGGSKQAEIHAVRIECALLVDE